MLTILAIFGLAGIVKGVIGLGLPTISLALLTSLFDLPSAMAMLLVPTLITNLWQGFAGEGTATLLRQLWPFLLAATLSVGFGSLMLTRIDSAVLSAALGIVLMLYALIGLMGRSWNIAKEQHLKIGVACGICNGLISGMTGSLTVPGVFYLQGIGLSRDQLVKAMGLLFALSGIALALGLLRNGMLSIALLSTSAIGVIPALCGMWLGERQLRKRLSERRFKQLFYVSLLILGAGLLMRSLF